MHTYAHLSVDVFIVLQFDSRLCSPPSPPPSPQELPLKVQEVMGLYVPSSSEEESPDSQVSETQRLLSQPEAGAASCNSAPAAGAAGGGGGGGPPAPTYP